MRGLFRFLFSRRRARYLEVWELEEGIVRAAQFHFVPSGQAACVGFAKMRRGEEEGRADFWIRASRALRGELHANLPRRARRQQVFLLGAGLLRFIGERFLVRRREAGRELSDEEIEECLLALLPQVRETMKGQAAKSFGLERHEVSVVDGVLEGLFLDGRALGERKSGMLRERGLGRELTFQLFLLFSSKEVVRDFGSLLRAHSLKEFSLLPLLVPLVRCLQVQPNIVVSGVLIFFDEGWAEFAFLREGRLVRNTVVSIGIRTVREAVMDAIGFGGQAGHELFSLWVSGRLSSRAAARLEELLGPTFALLREVLSSSLDTDISTSSGKLLWLFGPGKSIPGLSTALGGNALREPPRDVFSLLPVIPEELSAQEEEILPLAAAGWFVTTSHESSPWQERFIRALRLMQR